MDVQVGVMITAIEPDKAADDIPKGLAAGAAEPWVTSV
jgi:hypothetical protein